VPAGIVEVGEKKPRGREKENHQNLA